jgi:hypothetical protein
MNKKELEQMEKYWTKYHKSIPDYPIDNRRLDKSLCLLMAFLIGMLLVLCVWLAVAILGGMS